MDDITILVPIYNAYQTTRKCLEKLLQLNPHDGVLLIDDCSTDQQLIQFLADINAQTPDNWQLLKNSANQGFVKTANRGLRATKGHSILLNADTEVTSGWLQRFKEAISNVSQLATATPWSNNAEICSLPKTLTNNSMPLNADEIAMQLKDRHLPHYPDIPTAVGFCMLVTAQAKNKVGYFNDKIFGHGYGEENDYSLRASDAGMRNILLDNAYITHVGNQSFKELNMQPDKQSMQRLLLLHPHYVEIIEKFIKKDPLSPIRNQIIAKIDAFQSN